MVSLATRIAAAVKALVKGADLPPAPAAPPWLGPWGFDRPPGAAIDYARAAGDLSANTVVAICIGWLADNLPTARLQVLERQADGSEDPAPDDPLLALLARPNPAYSADVLWGATVLDFKVDGNAYWIKWRTMGGSGPPAALWHEPARNVTPIRDKDSKNLVDRYKIKRPGEAREYELEAAEVVHFRDGIDPANPAKGCARLKRVLRPIVGYNRVEDYTAGILDAGGTGGILMPLPADPATGGSLDEAIALRLKARIREQTTGANAGGWAVLNVPLNAQKVGLNPQEMALDTIPDRLEATICAALGVSPMVVGLTVGAVMRSYANQKEAESQTWNNGLVPMMKRLAADGLTVHLLPDFGPAEGRRCAWDFSEVKALQEDADAKAARAVSLWQARLGRLGECRALAGLPSIPELDEEWYDPAGPGAQDQGVPEPLRNGATAANGQAKSLFDLGPIDFESAAGPAGGVATKAAPKAAGKAHWITVWSRHANRFVHIRIEGDRHARGSRRVTAVRKGSPADLEAGVERAKAETGLDLHAEHGPPRGPAERKFAEKAHAAGKAAVVAEARPIVRVESAGDATRYHVGGRLTREVRPVRGDDPGVGPRDRFAITSRGQRGEVDHEGYHATREAAEAAGRRSAETIADEEGSIHSGRHATRLAVADLVSHDYADAAYHDPHWTTTFRLLTGP